MSVITIYTHKGGAGKTTAVVTIAGILSETHKKNILVVDTDSQMNCTNKLLSGCEAYRLQDDLASERRNDLRKALETGEVRECIFTATFPKKHPITGRESGSYQIDVLPGNEYLEATTGEHTLKEVLDKVKGDYDFILIDTPPSQAGIVLDAFIATDYLLIPTALRTDHLDGAVKALRLLSNLKGKTNAKPLGIFGTAYQSGVSLQRHWYDTYRERLGDTMFATATRYSTILDEAAAFGLPITSYKPKHIVCSEYKKLTNEILKKIKKKSKEK